MFINYLDLLSSVFLFELKHFCMQVHFISINAETFKNASLIWYCFETSVFYGAVVFDQNRDIFQNWSGFV